MPSRILCCSSNRAAVSDVYSPLPPQVKKSIIREWEKSETATTCSASTAAEQGIIETTTVGTVPLLEKEQVQPTESVFRSTPSLISEVDDMDDLLSLKRANPVFDDDYDSSDDAATHELLPASKRQRRANTTDEKTTRELTLHWDDRIVQDVEGGYQILVVGSPL